ncbi:MAG: 4Fe-4S binding protein [Peptococcaceae bacterium]|jgi:MinD superfamily P-loop ATPase|nr:4Fe-4S binding protein [Peptococcaceae bacterium]NLM21714.1 4Fe-4S binding protein [Peptococcaceae bacterium]
MKQLLILSGKGGTGKTTVASAFIQLAAAKAYADCDVDAPNLHLVRPLASPAKVADYYGMGKALIDEETCINCGSCRQHCRFEAIKESDGKYEVDVFACEGCGVCEAICPVGAVVLQPDVAGELRVYKDKDIFSTARLKMGSGTSGKLVTEVKKQLKDETENLDIDLSVIDGSPGIGCPVIASLSGVDMVLIVAEPSLSGISDMERIIKLAQGFSLKLAVCVNKYDTNPDLTHKIEAFCREHGLPFAGKIPFDAKALKATNQGQSIIEVDCSAGRAVTEVYSNTMNVLNKE